MGGKALLSLFTLPGVIDTSQVTAVVDNGILRVTAPKETATQSANASVNASATEKRGASREKAAAKATAA
jgi:hypothetical protein